jgi:hypothetical protein
MILSIQGHLIMHVIKKSPNPDSIVSHSETKSFDKYLISFFIRFI